MRTYRWLVPAVMMSLASGAVSTAAAPVGPSAAPRAASAVVAADQMATPYHKVPANFN